jgi:hypothetical protein
MLRLSRSSAGFDNCSRYTSDLIWAHHVVIAGNDTETPN